MRKTASGANRWRGAGGPPVACPRDSKRPKRWSFRDRHVVWKQHSTTTLRGKLQTPKKAANARLFCFTIPPDFREGDDGNIFQQSLSSLPFVALGNEAEVSTMMGIVMKKLGLSVALLALGVGAASAADLPAKVYTKAPAPVVVSPWDIAFGAAVMSDYVFRGVTQSNHKPSVTAYFEPRYNINPNLQLYAGTSFESISFANRAAAEVDVYGGIRPTFGAAAFDFGVWGYLYPGGQCIDNGSGVCPPGAAVLPNGNVMKKDVSFYEAYAKVTYTFNDYFAMGGNVYYSPNFLNSGADGTYASVTAKATAPGTWFGTSGVGAYLSGEFGRQWLGTSDSFYSLTAPFGPGIKYADYNTWNVGIGFTYKVFTLDLRYSDTDLSKGNCNAFTSAFNASGTTNVTGINPGGAGTNWCGSTFIAKFGADLTAMTNLK